MYNKNVNQKSNTILLLVQYKTRTAVSQLLGGTNSRRRASTYLAKFVFSNNLNTTVSQLLRNETTNLAKNDPTSNPFFIGRAQTQDCFHI